MINGSGWSFINGTFVNITFIFSSLNPTVLIYRKIINPMVHIIHSLRVKWQFTITWSIQIFFGCVRLVFGLLVHFRFQSKQITIQRICFTKTKFTGKKNKNKFKKEQSKTKRNGEEPQLRHLYRSIACPLDGFNRYNFDEVLYYALQLSFKYFVQIILMNMSTCRNPKN